MRKRDKWRLKIFPQGTFEKANNDDPLLYYYRPLIGLLYKYRIEQGLSLLSPPYENILEFGYGSGLLLPTLAEISPKIYGVDIFSDPSIVGKCLEKINIKANLYHDDLLRISFPPDFFDLIVAFSVFEHIYDCRSIIEELHRILKPGGVLLVGMPRVDKTMTKLFALIRYKGIEQHHVTDDQKFLDACRGLFFLHRQKHVFPFLPARTGIYFNMLLNKI